MKSYRVPVARLNDWCHPAPERTAYRHGQGIDFDVTCQLWSNRAAMLQACKMSDTGALGARPWRPLVQS
jgi:hypothetical protein